jgi:hypothetical protein
LARCPSTVGSGLFRLAEELSDVRVGPGPAIRLAIRGDLPGLAKKSLHKALAYALPDSFRIPNDGGVRSMAGQRPLGLAVVDKLRTFNELAPETAEDLLL